MDPMIVNIYLQVYVNRSNDSPYLSSGLMSKDTMTLSNIPMDCAHKAPTAVPGSIMAFMYFSRHFSKNKHLLVQKIMRVFEMSISDS